MKKEETKETVEEVDNLNSKENSESQVIEQEIDWKDKYIRLYAEFENYKKRSLRDKEDIKSNAITKTIEVVLDLNDDLNLSKKSITDSTTLDGINLIIDKVSTSLSKIGIEEIPTDEYNIDLHEVISVVGDGKKIIDVLSKGYTLYGTPFKYPKVVLA